MTFCLLFSGIHIGKTMLQMVPDLPPAAITANSILKPPGFQLAEVVTTTEVKPVAPAATVPLPTKPIWICRWPHPYNIFQFKNPTVMSQVHQPSVLAVLKSLRVLLAFGKPFQDLADAINSCPLTIKVIF
jgi:hypothetical protein